MNHLVLQFVNLFLAGILAGEEFVVCYRIRPCLSVMEEMPQIRFRQSLILRLRVLVPSIFVLALLSIFAVLVLIGTGPGFAFRCAGTSALLVFTLVTLMGTVPINSAALTWSPDAPPTDWKATIVRWERLDVVRCWAALVTFACLLIAVANLPGS